MFKKNKQPERGIIALFPAIIISGVLIILCVGVSQSFLAFLYRTTIFDDEVQSAIIAHSCALRVWAKHIQDSHYTGGETIFICDKSCLVGVFSTTTGSVFVKIGEAQSVENVSYLICWVGLFISWFLCLLERDFNERSRQPWDVHRKFIGVLRRLRCGVAPPGCSGGSSHSP